VSLRVIDLGRMGYRGAYEVQCAHVEEVLAARAAGTPEWGRVLVVEHEPVITVSRRKGAREHLVATAAQLSEAGVAVEETDRGGDITYHGPGQLVVYPILDLNSLMLGLHDYMRLLEQAVIDACAVFGVKGERDAGATGVWVDHHGVMSKVAAMGVRVRKWVSMHGLALNVEPDLSHFQLIVPCGLAGRPVTSLRELLGGEGPSMDEVRGVLVGALERLVVESAERARAHRKSEEALG
jgi:lipoyl(octanoyl) transferase